MAIRWSLCVVLLIALQSSEAIKCTEEDLTYATGKSSLFCVFRGLAWREGQPEPDFEKSTRTQVAIVDSNLTSIPESFFSQFPRLDIFVANNVNLTRLKINTGMRVVYAEKNPIVKLLVAAGNSLKELHLKENSLPNLSQLDGLSGLEVLDLSESEFWLEDNTIDFAAFAKMPNLTTLIVSKVEAYYVENPKGVTLPNLKVLNLADNPITPSNFEMSVFQKVPQLEVLSLRNTLMSSLAVSVDIRNDFPALKSIDIIGTNLKCSFMIKLLEHLREKNIEVVGASKTSTTKCNAGYDAMDGICCISDIPKGNEYVPPPPSPPQPPQPQPPQPQPQPQPPQPQPPSDQTTTQRPIDKTDQNAAGEEGGSSTVVIVSVVVAIILLIAVGGLVALYLKRRSEASHKAVPSDESHDNL